MIKSWFNYYRYHSGTVNKFRMKHLKRYCFQFTILFSDGSEIVRKSYIGGYNRLTALLRVCYIFYYEYPDSVKIRVKFIGRD